MGTTTPPFELALEPMEERRPQPAPRPADDQPLTIDITAEVRRQVPARPPAPPSLALVEPAPAAVEPAPPSEAEAPSMPPPARAAAPAGEDRFMAQARREYAAGTIDTPLWTRACAQTGGDEQAALAIYLKSRSTALRVLARSRTDVRGPRTVSPASGNADRQQAQQDRVARLRPASRLPVRTLAIASVALVALAGAALFLLGNEDKPAAAVSLAKPPAPAAAKPASAPVQAAPVQLPQESEETRLVARVIEMREKGQWNPMVLLATQWTRQSPKDPLAWEALTTGYVHLGQWQDAVEAGSTAVRLAPDNAILWRQLGLAYIEVGRPKNALEALQRSVALNERDAEALSQIGLIAVDLGELSEARSAFDRALAIMPTDVTSLCGSISVAERQGRRRDAEPAERQLRSLQAKCPQSDRHPGLAAVGRPQADVRSVQAPAQAVSGPRK